MICLDVIGTLIQSFDDVYGPICVSGEDAGHHEPEVFGWLYRLPEEFNDLLKQKHPAALMILAYFVVLLKELGNAWYMEGWVDHILEGIVQFLGKQYEPTIDWPIQEIRKVEAGET
jgi:hypothetical protein